MFNIPMFIRILSLGVAIPCSFIFIFNIMVKAKVGEQYELDLTRLCFVYALSLIGWAAFFGGV